MPNRYVERDTFTYDYSRIPPAESFEEDYFFPAGPRYRFKVEKAAFMEDTEGEYQFISVKIRCTKAVDPDCVGQAMRSTYTVPFDSQLEEADEKELKSLLFPLRKWHSLAIACGMSKQEAKATTRFSKLEGKEFEATTTAHTGKVGEREKTKADGTTIKVKTGGKLKSYLDQVYRIGDNKPSDAEAPDTSAAEAEFEDWK